MRKNNPTELPIENLLQRLQSDFRMSKSEKAEMAYAYHRSLSLLKTGTMATVGLVAGGALSTHFNQVGLGVTFCVLATVAAGYTKLTQMAHNETVDFLRTQYDPSRRKPQDP